MNRRLAPNVDFPKQLSLPTLEKRTLSNGIPVYYIPDTSREIVKVDWIFTAGKWYEEKNLVADLANRMLRSGTTRMTATEISTYFDSLGSQLSSTAGNDYGVVSLHSLSRYAAEQLEHVYQLLTDSTVPDDELRLITSNRKQRLLVDLEKNDVICNRLFVQSLFGQQHPYGRCTEPEDYDKLIAEEINTFIQHFYHGGNVFLIIAGKADESFFNRLEDCFGNKDWLRSNLQKPVRHALSSVEKVIYREREKTVQSAIQIGMRTISREHEDFTALTFANLILGGYFGSRLMTNIREDKGYTYGIYSALASYRNDCFLEIAAEVGKEVRLDTIREIEKEIRGLQQHTVEEEEWRTAKNYLIGKMIRSTDGAFRYSDTLRGTLMHGRDEMDFHRIFREVNLLSPEDVQRIAQTYLSWESMYQISVG